VKRLWKLVVVCSMGIALGACGSDSSDDGGAGTGGGGGSGGSGGGAAATPFGSCDKPDHDTCIEYSCGGANCDAYATEAQSDCDEVWSTSACKSGAIVRCQFSISGVVAVTHYYEGDQADRESACTMGGGTVL
jgi:hypothetical protein